MEFKIKVEVFLYKIAKLFKKLARFVKKIAELIRNVCLMLAGSIKLTCKAIYNAFAYFVAFFVSVYYFFANQNVCDIDERKYLRSTKKVRYPLKTLEIRFKVKNIFAFLGMVFSTLFATVRMSVVSVREQTGVGVQNNIARIKELKGKVEQNRLVAEAAKAEAAAEGEPVKKTPYFKTPEGKITLKRTLAVTAMVICVFAFTQIAQYKSTYAYESSAVKNNLIEAYSVDINGITCAIITDTQKAEKRSI